DTGLEYGMSWGSYFGRIALTNGESNPLGGQFAETKAVKLGYNLPLYQGGLSFYDNYQKEPFPPRKRATRWGYYSLTHFRSLAVLGEIAAGTDADTLGRGAVRAKTNLLAGFVEADYALGRSFNVRARYDYLDTDRSSNNAIRDANTHHRYALEGEWVPVPFAELRAAARRIVHRDELAFGHDNETQLFVQAHFSY